MDPCSLVTRADAERILGARVGPAIRRESVLMATGKECRYTAIASAKPAADARSIDLVVYDDATVRGRNAMFRNAADYFRRDMAALRSSGTTLVPVSGLGTTAYWQPGAGLLHVLYGGVYVMLDVNADFPISPWSEDQKNNKLDAARRRAEIALARDTILPRIAHLSAAPTQQTPPAGGARGLRS